MLEQVCNLGSEAAKLAYDCLREYRSPEKLDPTLEDRLKALTVDVNALLYQQLEDYLKNQQWYEADQETWKLMLKVTNLEERGWLDLDDIKNFPCEDLLTLDRLWVDYSKKHGFEFGFNVQKQIYVECGGNLDFSYPMGKTWGKFCDRTAWTKDGKYVSYPDPFFSNNFLCVKGHLPEVGRRVVRHQDEWEALRLG